MNIPYDRLDAIGYLSERLFKAAQHGPEEIKIAGVTIRRRHNLLGIVDSSPCYVPDALYNYLKHVTNVNAIYITDKETDMCQSPKLADTMCGYNSPKPVSAEARREELKIQLESINAEADKEKAERQERERQAKIRELVSSTLAYDQRAREILKEAEELKKAYDAVRANAAFNRGQLLELGVRLDPNDPS